MPKDPTFRNEDGTPLRGIWHCKIGETDWYALPDGSDLPMHKAVAQAYRELTGRDPEYIFSGWNGELTEGERNCVNES
jgi:acetylornithine deacetylase/succinyl-diaminopimelate desuccinylase-like protein